MPPSLRSTREIRTVVAARCVGRARTLRVHAADTPSRAGYAAQGRAAVVAGRDVGGAVSRNRAKRRIRAALDLVGVPDSTDLVVRAAPGAVTAPWTLLVADLKRALTRALAMTGNDPENLRGTP